MDTTKLLLIIGACVFWIILAIIFIYCLRITDKSWEFPPTLEEVDLVLPMYVDDDDEREIVTRALQENSVEGIQVIVRRNSIQTDETVNSSTNTVEVEYVGSPPPYTPEL
ncbi:hypothetical protein HK103_001274 [Boothiomyces macroporosus]|uniref:Uncharacterized protein n=1 Tax=Boothiomyces macroporosus TaxID=261099 RepID=A0AAD5UB12_9FUNG|nr:hypothetical protein HK103_001272 [Boothiomyces macroporosus]KAJ3252774.1 hypothetical protein HK103_001274 [Boothiomyces macroporosus]